MLQAEVLCSIACCVAITLSSGVPGSGELTLKINFCFLSLAVSFRLLLKSIFKQILGNTLIYFVLCIVTFLMLRTIIGYASFNATYAFLAQKQDYLDNKVWLSAFYTHVFTSLFALAAGFTQFSKYLLRHHKKLHRSMGKMYIVAVLFINVPAGFIMALYANGLLSSKLAFLILDCLWFYFTYKGWRSAINKDFKTHRRWMIRSYALTFSAITLRTWRMVLAPVVPDPLVLYMIDAWMGFVPNLLFVEWFLKREKNKQFLAVKTHRNRIKQTVANN